MKKEKKENKTEKSFNVDVSFFYADVEAKTKEEAQRKVLDMLSADLLGPSINEMGTFKVTGA